MSNIESTVTDPRGNAVAPKPEAEKVKETYVIVNGKKYSHTLLDKLKLAAETYANQHLTGKEAEAYKNYAASIVNDIKEGKPVFLENGLVRKKTLPTKNNKYKSGTEKFIFDKQLNQFFGLSGKSGSQQSSVSETEEAYNKALAESKKKLNLAKYLSETYYGGEMKGFNHALLKDPIIYKDLRLDHIKGAIKEAARLKGIDLSDGDLLNITKDNVVEKAIMYGLDIDVVKKYLGIGSSTSSSVQLPQGYTLVENGDLMSDKHYYVATNEQGQTKILKNNNGTWTEETLDRNRYLGDTNTYLNRDRNGVIFTDNQGNIHIGNYGESGFTKNDHQALANLQDDIDKYAETFFQTYDHATGLGDGIGKSSILDSILPEGGKIADITSQFSLDDKYKVLLTGDSEFGNWASYSNTRGLIYDTELNKSIPVAIHRDPASNKVTITGSNGTVYYDGFLNNYTASNLEWAGGKLGTAFYDNPLINSNIPLAEVMINDRRQRPLSGFTRSGVYMNRFLGALDGVSQADSYYTNRDTFSNDIRKDWVSYDYLGIPQKGKGHGIVDSINDLADDNDWTDNGAQDYAKFVYNLFPPEEWPKKLQELGLRENQITQFLTNLANLLLGGPQQPASQKQGGSITKIPKAQLGLGIQPGQATHDFSKLKALKQSAQQNLAIKDANEQARATAPTRIGGTGNRTWNGHDYASLASSALTVGSLAGGPLGLICQGTATVMDLFNDMTNDNVSSADMWKNLGWNLAFTALSAVPFLGNLKLAKSAGKGFSIIKLATGQISEAKKALDKAGKLDDAMKATLDIVKKGSKEAGVILKEPGLIEAGLQSIGKFGLGAVKVAGHAASGLGVVSGVSSATSAISDIADGKGVSLNDIEGVAFGIAATRNLGKLAERFAIKRVTKGTKETVAQASKQSFKIGDKTIEVDIPAGSKRSDVKTQLKTKLDELLNSLKTQQSQLLNGQQASALTGDAKTKYDAIQSQLDDLVKVDIDKEMRKIGNLWTSTKTKIGDLKQTTKNRWDAATNGFDEGRIIMGNAELEAKGLGMLEKWGIARAKKYGFYLEGLDLEEYLLRLKPNKSYLDGLGIQLKRPTPNTPPTTPPPIIAEPNGQLAWAFKKGGQLSTLRRIIKANQGIILRDLDNKELQFNTLEQAEEKIRELVAKDPKSTYEVEPINVSGTIAYYRIKQTPKEQSATNTTSMIGDVSASVNGPTATEGTIKPVNDGNDDKIAEGGVKPKETEKNDDETTDELLARIFLNNNDVEDNNDQKIRTYDPYYFSAAAKYLGDLATNARVYNDIKPTGPVYKTPVYKYNQTNDGAFTYSRGQEQEATEQLFNAIQEGATSDSSINLGAQLNAAKNLLLVKSQLAADRETRLGNDYAKQDQNEYANRVESRDVSDANRVLSDTYLRELGTLRAQKDAADGASRNNFILGLYTRAEETIDAANEQRMSEQWYKEYEVLLTQITQLGDAKNAKIKQIKDNVAENPSEELTTAALARIQEEENNYIKAKAKLEADFEKRWSTMPTPLHGQYQWLPKSRQSATPDASTTLVVSTNKSGGSLTLAERKELEFVKAKYKKLQKMQDRLEKQIKETNKQANLTMGALQKERLQLLKQQHEIRRK